MRKFIILLLLMLSSHLFGSVVGIHGFVANQTTMLKMERCLEKAGFDFTYYRYESRKETIECHAVRLKETLKRMAACHPGEPINFVCHSIGGLVLRAAVCLPDCPEEAKVGRAVLLAPPNQGSMLARKFRDFLPIRMAMGNKSGLQLMTYNECQMAQFGCFPSTMQVLVLAGDNGTHMGFDGRPNDGFLAVEETRLNSPHAFMILHLTHGALLSNEVSIRITRDFLLCGTLPNCEKG